MTTKQQSHESNRSRIKEFELPNIPIPTQKQMGMAIVHFAAFGILVNLYPSLLESGLEAFARLSFVDEHQLETVLKTLPEFIFDGTERAGAAYRTVITVLAAGFVVRRTDYTDADWYITKLHIAGAVGVTAVVLAVLSTLGLLLEGFEMFANGERAIATVGPFLHTLNTSTGATYGLFFVIPAMLASIGIIEQKTDYRPFLVSIGLGGACIGVLNGITKGVNEYYNYPDIFANKTLLELWDMYLFQEIFKGLALGMLLAVLALVSVAILSRFHDWLRSRRSEPAAAVAPE